MKNMEIGFGGGCHWCTEAVFQALKGVARVEQGFISSTAPHDAFSEAVLVTYDPLVISTADLVEIHLRTHSSDSNHQFRDKYRSAIYYQCDNDGNSSIDLLDLQAILAQHAKYSEKELVTQILLLVAFRPSNQRYKDYYLNNPEKPFCKTYIDPKLSLLREKYSEHLC